MEGRETKGEKNLDAFLNSLLLLYEKQFSDKSSIDYKKIIMNILIHIYKQCKNNKNIDTLVFCLLKVIFHIQPNPSMKFIKQIKIPMDFYI